jgi:hypothetical protein
VHLFRPSLSFLAEARRGVKTAEDERHFLAEVHITFFRRPHELQSKRQTSLEKLQIYFVSTFSKYVDKFIKTYILTIFYSICDYELVNKTRYLLFAIQLLIYIIYGDRTIIGL